MVLIWYMDLIMIMGPTVVADLLQEKDLVRILLELGQEHLFAEWPPAGNTSKLPTIRNQCCALRTVAFLLLT